MKSEPRQLRELRNLMPWTWDSKLENHPPGEDLHHTHT